jgi:hypothetical protein
LARALASAGKILAAVSLAHRREGIEKKSDPSLFPPTSIILSSPSRRRQEIKARWETRYAGQSEAGSDPPPGTSQAGAATPARGPAEANWQSHLLLDPQRPTEWPEVREGPSLDGTKQTRALRAHRQAAEVREERARWAINSSTDLTICTKLHRFSARRAHYWTCFGPWPHRIN